MKEKPHLTHQVQLHTLKEVGPDCAHALAEGLGDAAAGPGGAAQNMQGQQANPPPCSLCRVVDGPVFAVLALLHANDDNVDLG